MKKKLHIIKIVIAVFLWLLVLPGYSSHPGEPLSKGMLLSNSAFLEANSWQGVFTIKYKGQIERVIKEKPWRGTKLTFEHMITIHFTTADGMVSADPYVGEVSGAGKAEQEKIIEQMKQGGQVDVDALMKMAEGMKASGMDGTSVKSWSTTSGTDNIPFKNGLATAEYSVTDHLSGIEDDIGEGYCCTYTWENNWSGKSQKDVFEFNLTINKATGKYHMDVNWDDVCPSVEHTYTLISVIPCPDIGSPSKCEPYENKTEIIENYTLRPKNTKNIKELLKNLPLPQTGNKISGSKTLNGFYSIDGVSVDVELSWEMAPKN
ncbi:MAG: hypothetical protein GXO83_13795 [Chlorobi bacterium]|nr:hypothetical protein [Chlorobiota bacterium]